MRGTSRSRGRRGSACGDPSRGRPRRSSGPPRHRPTKAGASVRRDHL